MTNDEINKAIASHLFEQLKEREEWIPNKRTDDVLLYGGASSKGLWIYKDKKGYFRGMNYNTKEALEKCELEQFSKQYDFCTDLNACREAVKSTITTPQLKVLFLNTLRSIVFKRIKEPVSDFEMLTAETREWSEAFLRTVGKWKE